MISSVMYCIDLLYNLYINSQRTFVSVLVKDIVHVYLVRAHFSRTVFVIK